jgi:hypothetical protein
MPTAPRLKKKCLKQRRNSIDVLLNVATLITDSQFHSESTAEDLKARVRAIQEREIDQIRDLSSLLDGELKFAEQYVKILKEAKSGWAEQ